MVNNASIFKPGNNIMNREIMAVVQRRPENDKISVPSLDGRRSRKGDGMCKKLRRSHFCFFLKPLWMTLLALSTTETTRPMMLSRFYSLIRPLCVPVDAYTFARRVGAGRFGRNVKGVDDDNRVSLLLLMRRSRHCDDDERDLWNAGRRLSFFRLAATPSKRTALPNSPSEADRTKSPSLQLYIAAYSNRPNITLFTNSTTIAEEAIAKNVSPPLNSRRTTNGKSRNSIRAKLHETRQRLVSTVEDDVLQAPPLTQAYCVYLMAECVAHDEWDLVLDVLDLMKRASLRQERSTYVACLQACFQTANAASAREILSAMAVAQIPPEISDYALVILAMCRKDQTERGWWRKALKLLQEVTPLTEASNHSDLPLAAYDAILSCMVEERQWQESLRLLRFMEQQLSRRVDSDNTSAATTTIVEPSVRAQANRTRPALSTYRTVIECCVASNQAEQAVQVLQSCVNTGLTPTLYAFELVIGALSKKLQWRRALQLVDLMEELGVPRTLQIYNFILTSCAKAREAVPAKAVLVRMRQRDAIAPNIISYNSVLSVCASTSRWKDALTILDRAHREPGVTPDVYTYTNAIRACAKGGKTERALSLFQVVKDKGLPLDSYCYTAAMEACEWHQALKLLQEMEGKGIGPSEVAYSITIKACGAEGQWRRALDLLEMMRSKKLSINLYVYNAAITAVSKAAKQLSKSGDSDGKMWMEVIALLHHMQQDGIEPDGFSFSSAISCCGSEGRWKEALVLIEAMQQGGPKTKPNKVCYTAAISSCGKAGQVDHALRLFREMKGQGLSADRVAYNALFSALRISKRAEAAFELWDEMLGHASFSETALLKTAESSTSPDIITVTDAIGAMSSGSDNEVVRLKVEIVFAEAVRLGVVLRHEMVASCWRYDFTGLAFPVARAACRYIISRIQCSVTESPKDLTIITGIGAQRRNGSGLTSLREYVQGIFLRDFSPGLVSVVPDPAHSILVIEAETLAEWLKQ